MKPVVESPTSGKALLVNPKRLIDAARKYAITLRNIIIGGGSLSDQEIDFLEAVSEYEELLRKGGRKP
jgi:hypothetical protein